MDPKSNEGIFLGYSINSRAYKVFNSRTNTMMESINVVVDDSTVGKGTDVEEDVGTSSQQTDALENFLEIESYIEPVSTDSSEVQVNKGPSIRIQKDHLNDHIIGNLNEMITTRFRDVIFNSCFVSKFEPKNMKESLTDDF
jgi:hypothetical protein